MNKVLLITGSLPPMSCGVGYYSSSLLRHINDDKILLEILTTAEGSSIDDKFVIHKARSWRIRDLPSIISQCKRAQADIIHIQYPSVGYGRKLGINLLPWLLRLFVRKSYLVVTLHEYFGSPLLGRVRDLITVLPTNKLIVSNQADFHALPRMLVRKMRIIPLGPNIESSSPDLNTAKKLLANTKDLKTVLFFGFAFASKRLELLIQSMENLKDMQLVIVSEIGENIYHKSLLAQIKALNNRVGFDQIRVIGFQSNAVLVAIIQQSFCFVLPQSTPVNNKSSTAIAAVANELPVIGQKGSDWENSPFVDRVNALLLEEMNAETIAASVNALVLDSALHEKIKQGSEGLANQFTWKNVAEMHHKLYTNIGGIS